MEWQDRAVILGTRGHSETSVIVELFTRDHGRHLGLVRGGASRRQRPSLQIGNLVAAEWRARLAEHLGTLKIEIITPHAAKIMDDRAALAGLGALCALTTWLPERDPHPGLYDAFTLILDHLPNESVWPGLLVRWELELLNELGFGLDLTKCAGTGTRHDLAYVSPKSGRAVSLDAGKPYKDKLLRLPSFLLGLEQSGAETGTSDIVDGFTLTGYFLQRYVAEPRGLQLPNARARAIQYLVSQSN